METWVKIDAFPNYSVSNHGRVRNDVTGRLLTTRTNQRGIVYVILFTGDGYRNVRAVATLVAEAFVEVPFNDPTYNTIIHLNGDRTNAHSTNLAWRQRWFALAYIKQFESDWRGYKVPVKNLDTGEIFPNTWEASIRYGLIEKKLVVAMHDEVPIWPTRHRYELA